MITFMDQTGADATAAYILAQTAAGEVADFTRREGYSADSKPRIKAELLRQLLLGRVEGVNILPPGVRILGVRVEGPVDLRDCAGEGLAALCLEDCDFDDAINLANSRVARLSIRQSRIRGLLASGLSSDGHVDFTGVTAFPAAGPIAFVDLRGARIRGSVTGSGATLKALPQDQNVEGHFPAFALDLTLATVDGALVVDRGFTAEGGVSLHTAVIGGPIQATSASFTAAALGGYAILASTLRVGASVMLNGGFSATGLVSFDDVNVEGVFDCSGARFSNKGSTALSLSRARIDRGAYFSGTIAEGAIAAFSAHIGEALRLDNGFSANGPVYFDDVTIAGTLDCSDARFSNRTADAETDEASTAFSATRAQIDGSVFFHNTIADRAVSLMNARVGLSLAIWGAKISHPPRYALNLQSARIEGELQAFDNAFEGAVTLSGAYIGRLYDLPETAWAGASAIELNELTYTALSAKPWFFSQDRSIAQRKAMAKSKHPAWRPVWKVRAEWLKRNTGTVGKDTGPFSNQPWRECAAALDRAGHHGDARRLAREEQREVNRQRTWWKRPFVWMFAEQAFGYGLSVTRATMTSLIFWLAGWAGAEEMLRDGVLIDEHNSTASVCTRDRIDPAVYALDVAIPVIDLKAESSCQPGRITDGTPTALLALGWFRVDDVSLWRWAKAIYAILGAIVIGFTILTYSGVFKPKASDE